MDNLHGITWLQFYYTCEKEREREGGRERKWTRATSRRELNVAAFNATFYSADNAVKTRRRRMKWRETQSPRISTGDGRDDAHIPRRRARGFVHEGRGRRATSVARWTVRKSVERLESRPFARRSMDGLLPRVPADADDHSAGARTSHSQDSQRTPRRVERRGAVATRRCRGVSSTALGPPSQITLALAMHDTYWARPPAPRIYIVGAAGSATLLTFVDSPRNAAEAALRRRRCRWKKPLVRNLQRNRRTVVGKKLCWVNLYLIWQKTSIRDLKKIF